MEFLKIFNLCRNHFAALYKLRYPLQRNNSNVVKNTRNIILCQTVSFNIKTTSEKPFLLAVTLTGLLEYIGLKEEKEDSELIKIIKRAIILTKNQQWNKAEQMYHIALKLAQDLQDEQGVTYIYDKLGNIAYDRGDHHRALSLLSNVMQRLLRSGTDPDDNAIIHLSLKLAKVFENLKQLQNSETGYLYCISNLEPKMEKAFEDNDENTILLWLLTLNWLARFYFSTKNFTESVKYNEMAYDDCIKFRGHSHEHTIHISNDLASAYYECGNIDEAIKCWERSIRMKSYVLDKESFTPIYVNLGNAYLTKELHDKALISCERGLLNAEDYNDQDGISAASECIKEVQKALHIAS